MNWTGLAEDEHLKTQTIIITHYENTNKVSLIFSWLTEIEMFLVKYDNIVAINFSWFKHIAKHCLKYLNFGQIWSCFPENVLTMADWGVDSYGSIHQFDVQISPGSTKNPSKVVWRMKPKTQGMYCGIDKNINSVLKDAKEVHIENKNEKTFR